MKKLLLLSFLAISLSATSQTQTAYCDMMATNFWGGRNVYIILDFGSLAYGTINNEDDTSMKFSGIVDALNYMAGLGWSVRDTYSLTEGKSKVLHFLLEKKVTDSNDILYGLHILKKERNEKRQQYKRGSNGDDIY
jgi:hypothetical protein